MQSFWSSPHGCVARVSCVRSLKQYVECTNALITNCGINSARETCTVVVHIHVLGSRSCGGYDWGWTERVPIPVHICWDQSCLPVVQMFEGTTVQYADIRPLCTCNYNTCPICSWIVDRFYCFALLSTSAAVWSLPAYHGLSEGVAFGVT